MSRRTAIINKKPERAVIIGAGITEKYYFSHLQSLYNLKIKVRPRYFGNENISTLEKLMFLSSPKWVEEMCKDGKIENAYSRAQKIGMDGDSYSNLWKAIEYLGIFATDK